ncbi:MAG: tryptophan 7-halogenase [Planctomycetota bacterium]
MALRTPDVVVIGGGPAGAAAAALIAQAGYEVDIYERETFPRFAVGESLIPAVNLTLERLGVLGEMDRRGFTRKHAVQFYTAKGPGRPFYFSEVEDPRMHHTWQVLRSDFDAMLLDHAALAGAHVHAQTQVLDAVEDADGISGVRVRHHDGTESAVPARAVVDASGQQSLLARRFGRTHIEGLENTAVYAHFHDVRLDSGIDAGSTLIYRLNRRSWLWLIPVPGAVSIGLVAPAQGISSYGPTPEAILTAAIAASPDLQERMRNAQRATPVRAARDFSYRANCDGGAGWLLIGDSLGFIDPIYSTGLFLSMRSAEIGAAAVIDGLRDERPRGEFAGFSAEYQKAFDRFLVLVDAYYDEQFGFGDFARDPQHRQGLVDLLTGVVDTHAAGTVANALRARHTNGTEKPHRAPSPS